MHIGLHVSKRGESNPHDQAKSASMEKNAG